MRRVVDQTIVSPADTPENGRTYMAMTGTERAKHDGRTTQLGTFMEAALAVPANPTQPSVQRHAADYLGMEKAKEDAVQQGAASDALKRGNFSCSFRAHSAWMAHTIIVGRA